MGERGAVEAILGFPGDVLDGIVALLAKVGIDLMPIVPQLFLLTLIVALLVPTYRKLRARKKAERTPLIALVALGLAALGVIIGRRKFEVC